uniref:GH13495p n=3 Tax=Drosophila melanogaster TaxID=7227 RepID=Q9VBT7_DROME|nr:uncharacterized protein Dmel_CG10513 [Drosophila melanogaster]AAF56440.2 uncharacterized protein Dmel_CG10513 [Drosophila melanogaster]AAK92891.1 GH13495p [Drosophila melanogaster]AOQ12660.1 CG10513-PB [synthetic construct]|eukprot:NP_651370.2 uncharacterized protein Dmel_CG10513 [Drosophila melanogaster]
MVEQGKEDATEFHPAPEWLDETYLERLLRDLKNDPGLRITDLVIKPATAKGDNYASVMTRVRILFLKSGAKSPETEYYIVKTTYENDAFASGIFSQYQVSTTEMRMYEKILPQLSSLIEKTRQPEKVFAKTLHVDYEHEAIIFEDLAVTKYVLADRLVGFDLEHTRLGLRKLAKMHAAAAVLNERQPGLLTKFDHGIFNRHTQAFAPFFVNTVGVAADFARECPELGERYATKLKKLQERVMEYSTRVYDPQPGDFNTLVHGDYWVNNVMLRYGENKEPLDMTLIDFQFCSWSSPAVDLHYFFNTSVQVDIRYEQQDALFQYYHTVLVETLKDLNFGGYIPTLRQFVLQLERGRFFAVTVALVCQAILTNDQNADADFNALMKDDERGRNFRKVLYTNKRLQDNLKRELPRFDRSGLLDVID